MCLLIHFIFILWKGFIFIIICLTVCSIVLINNVLCFVLLGLQDSINSCLISTDMWIREF